MLIGYWPPRLTISSRRSGVSGRLTSATPSASATALAMHTGALIEFPSATPLAPVGVTGDGVSWMQDLQLRDHQGCRQGIVQKTAGEKAAVLGIDEPFVQGGTDRHSESTADL